MDVKMLRNVYPKGTRVELLFMKDEDYPVPSGTRGTVSHVDDAGTIHVNWDNGSSLGLTPDVDDYRKVY